MTWMNLALDTADRFGLELSPTLILGGQLINTSTNILHDLTDSTLQLIVDVRSYVINLHFKPMITTLKKEYRRGSCTYYSRWPTYVLSYPQQHV